MARGKASIQLYMQLYCKTGHYNVFCQNSTQSRKIADGADYMHTDDRVYSEPYEARGESVYEPIPT